MTARERLMIAAAFVVVAAGLVLTTHVSTRGYLQDSGQLVSMRTCGPVILNELARRKRLLELERELKEWELRDYASLDMN
jgi:hypothetical protein